MSNQTKKTNKEVSKFIFYISVFFSICGVIAIIGSIMTPLPNALGLVGIVWTLAFIIVASEVYKNGFAEVRLVSYHTNSSTIGDKCEFDFEEILRKIERLKVDGLISEDEYNQKRREVLNKDWTS